ncbi:MAG: LysR family transcriptional regulator [Pseudomonadales bacterium]
MDLRLLQSFYAVVHHGGFTAAGEALGVSKGLLSRHVNRLEQELGALLLQRSTRVVRPTQAGQALFLNAQKIMLLAAGAERELAQFDARPSGLLRFTAPISIGDTLVGDVLSAYSERCPDVELEFNFSNRSSDLGTGENDIALRAVARLPETAVATSVGRILNVLVVRRGFFAQTLAPHVLELNHLPCILNTHQQAWNVWHLHTAEGAHDVAVSGRYACAKYATALKLALAGAGVANLPYYLVEPYLNSGQLERVFEDVQASAHEMFIVHLAQRPLPAKIAIFKQLLMQWFEQRPQYLYQTSDM